MRSFRLIPVLFLFAFSFRAIAQAPVTPPAKPATTVEVTPKPSVDPSSVKIALLTEENLVLKGQAIQTKAASDTAPLQAQYNEQEKIIADWESDVKKKNGWGDDVKLDRASLKFIRTVLVPKTEVPATPAAEKK